MKDENKKTMDDVQQHEIVKVIYKPNPNHIYTLRPQYFKYIGKVLMLYCGWVAQEDESFPGQKIFLGYGDDSEHIRQWIPECDLQLIEILN